MDRSFDEILQQRGFKGIVDQWLHPAHNDLSGKVLSN